MWGGKEGLRREKKDVLYLTHMSDSLLDGELIIVSLPAGDVTLLVLSCSISIVRSANFLLLQKTNNRSHTTLYTLHYTHTHILITLYTHTLYTHTVDTHTVDTHSRHTQ